MPPTEQAADRVKALVERLEAYATQESQEAILVRWDFIREALEPRNGGTWPRELFENVIEGFCDDIAEAADALTALQARVGELEGDALRYRYLKEHHTSNYGMTREQPAEWTLCWDWQQIRPGEEFLGVDALIDADIARLDDDDRALLTPPLEQE